MDLRAEKPADMVHGSIGVCMLAPPRGISWRDMWAGW